MFDDKMFGGMDFSKMGDLISQAQKKVEEFQNDLTNKKFEATSGGGMVSVVVNGADELVDVKIDDELLGDKESLQILLISAVNDALNKAKEEKKSAAFGAFGNMFAK